MRTPEPGDACWYYLPSGERRHAVIADIDPRTRMAALIVLLVGPADVGLPNPVMSLCPEWRGLAYRVQYHPEGRPDTWSSRSAPDLGAAAERASVNGG